MSNYEANTNITSSAFSDLLALIKTEFNRRNVVIKTPLVKNYYDSIKNNTFSGITAGTTLVTADKVNEVIQLIHNFWPDQDIATTNTIVNNLTNEYSIINTLSKDTNGSTTCVAMCMGLCSGCGSGCSGGCVGEAKTTNQSTSCGDCGIGCTTSCGGGCDGCSGCYATCGTGCSLCSSSCGAVCQRACSGSCKGGCHNACRSWCTFEANTHPY